ncbi:MAG TPA: ABC transporter substrate-binding protein [Burkholderiaceae bacterium]
MKLVRPLLLVTALLSAGCITPAYAQQGRTLHVLQTNSETGMDPAVASDLTTLSLNENIFDPLLRYDYVARPVALQGNTASGLPEVSDGGRTYVFKLRKGVHFAPDPAFKGVKRELTAQDYVYTFMRLYDPALKSPWLFLFDGKLLGDEALKAAAKDNKFSYSLAIPGLQALDRYTLRVRLKEADANFPYLVATVASGAVAREVVEAYPGQTGNHPVGTGPFMVGEWQRANRIVLLANPHYNKIFHGAPGSDPQAQAVARELEGKKLPRVDRVEVKIVEEYQARMLGLFNRQFDLLEQVPPAMSDLVFDNGKLKAELARKGIVLSLFTTMQTYYMWMNMDDPVIGGYTPDKIALRRAIAMSYNRAEDIRVLDKGLAVAAQSPLPPTTLGYNPDYRSSVPYDPKLANALLDRYGYNKRDAEGYRLQPNGAPLALLMHTLPSTEGRLRDEVWRKSLQSIGIRVAFKSDKKTEVIKASRLGKVQMFEINWVADFPDGDNFFQLLYGPNSGRANYARFNLPEFNQLYEQARRLGNVPERKPVYRKMMQLLDAYNPWVPRIHPVSADLRHPWVMHYLRHPVEFTNWRYLDIDDSKK